MKYKLLILLFLFSVNKVFSQDIIIELINTDTELNILNNRINVLTNEIKTLIKDKNILNIFNSQCDFWLRERNNCRNQSGQNYRLLVLNSLKVILVKRTKILESMINNLDLIIKDASQYNYIDPWYLKMFANDYNGKEIWLFGSLSMHNSEVISGKITGFDKNRTEIEILFYGPTSEAIMFFYRLMINNENIISHFFGQVGIKDGELYIYMDPNKNI
jgi:hypothetical protein